MKRPSLKVEVKSQARRAQLRNSAFRRGRRKIKRLGIDKHRFKSQ